MLNIYQNFTEKYRPKSFKDILGQEKAIGEIKVFLGEFPKKRALLLYGPAGTGKTSLVLSAAKENDLEIFELNASDLRNRTKLEEILKPASIQQSLLKKGKIILMDEVDGVTGTDIGGIPELIRVLEITKHPIIMTCNDIWQSKFSQLRQKCKMIEMKALSTLQALEILKKVAEKENIIKNPDFLHKIA